MNLLSLLKRPHKADPVLTNQHHSGPAFYHTGSLWAPCTISIHNSTVSVSCGRDISLQGCSDVRSVASDGELKVFELSFKDSKERFAVESVKERARWISVFWDAILPSATSTPNKSHDTLQFVPTSTSKTLPIPPPLSPLNPSRYSTLPTPPSPSKGKRKWPPPVSRWTALTTTGEDEPTPQRISMFTKIPLDADGVPSHIRREEASLSSPHVPRTPNNTLHTPSTPVSASMRIQALSNTSHDSRRSIHSGTKSTSIANLSRLSVVKTRLAAMEGSSQSPSRAQSKPSTPTTTSVHRIAFAQGAPSTRVDIPANSGHTDGRVLLKPKDTTPDGLPAPSTSVVPPPLPSKGPSTPSTQSKDEVGAGRVSDALQRLECKVDRVGGVVEDVRVALLDGLHHHTPVSPPSSKSAKEDTVQVKKELAKIHAKLHEMHQSQLQNLNTSLAGGGASAKALREADLGERLNLLESIGRETMEILKGLSTANTPHHEPEGNILLMTQELTTLRTLFEASHAQHVQQGAVQADSVRYLTELNGWLEAFVVQQQQSDQSPGKFTTSPSGVVEGGGAGGGGIGGGIGGGRQGAGQGIVDEVTQLVRGMKARDQSMAALQAAVNELVVGLGRARRGGGGGGGSSGGASDTSVLVQMIEKQRREQEEMLRVFTDEISDEIKGERLRFVEAMREATAINVQHHVSELKKEMGKEVFVMAREVERLHRDKQDVEQRIAELMDFYSKQAAAAGTGLRTFSAQRRSQAAVAGGGMHMQTYNPTTVVPGIPMVALSSEPTYMPQRYPPPPPPPLGRPSKAATLDTNAGYYYDVDPAKGSDDSGLKLEGRRSHFDSSTYQGLGGDLLQVPSSSRILDSSGSRLQHHQEAQQQQGQQHHQQGHHHRQQQGHQYEEQQHAISTTAASASGYQGPDNGMGGVGGAGPDAPVGVRSYGGGGGTTMKPVMDLRMKPLGSSGRRAAAMSGSGTPTPSGSRGVGGQGGGGGKLKERSLYTKPSTRRK